MMKKIILIVVSLFTIGFLLGVAINQFSSLDDSYMTNASCGHSIIGNESSTQHMALIPAGVFLMGSNTAYPEERTQHKVTLTSFWMDKYEVTNDQFAAFVAETGYVTTAENERLSGAAVFSQDQSWQYVEDANWRHPEGEGSNIEGKGNYPVVQVSYKDAKAYASWLGHDLPTEAQFEYAAQFDTRIKDDKYAANTWQGFFPLKNTADDGYLGAAPVGCFAENHFGLYDMIGNVWEWTNDWYAAGHVPEDALDPKGPKTSIVQVSREPSHVIKGGSYLCAENFCQRYRPSGRQPQEDSLGTNHIGFRTVKNL